MLGKHVDKHLDGNLFFDHSSQLAHCEEELNESKDLNVFLQDQIDEIKMQVNTSFTYRQRTLNCPDTE